MLKASNFFRSMTCAALFAVSSSAAVAQGAPAKADPAKGQQLSQTCAACHGADGNSTAPANPKLASQHADYLYKQLVNFVPKQGAKEAERANAIMAGFAATLSDDDRRHVAAWYSHQPPQRYVATHQESGLAGQKAHSPINPDKPKPPLTGG